MELPPTVRYASRDSTVSTAPRQHAQPTPYRLPCHPHQRPATAVVDTTGLETRSVCLAWNRSTVVSALSTRVHPTCGLPTCPVSSLIARVTTDTTRFSQLAAPVERVRSRPAAESGLAPRAEQDRIPTRVELFRVPRVSDVLLVHMESPLECTSARPALLAVMPRLQRVHSAPIAGLAPTPL